MAWLDETSASAAGSAAQYEAVAAGYCAALAAMPTLAELAANHALHSVLAATNFLGINTAPLAINEADYSRMWAQAAETMSAYQAVAEQSAAMMTTPAASPRVLDSSDGSSSSTTDPVKSLNKELRKFLQKLNDIAGSALSAPLANIVQQITGSLSSFLGGQVFDIVSHAVLDPVIYMGPFAPLLSPGLVLAAPGAGGLLGLVGAAPASAGPPAERVRPVEQEPPARALAAPPTGAEHLDNASPADLHRRHASVGARVSTRSPGASPAPRRPWGRRRLPSCRRRVVAVGPGGIGRGSSRTTGE